MVDNKGMLQCDACMPAWIYVQRGALQVVHNFKFIYIQYRYIYDNLIQTLSSLCFKLSTKIILCQVTMGQYDYFGLVMH